MKIFLVFDNSSFPFKILEKDCRRVEIFPLTANWDYINLVVNKLKSIDIESNLLNSAAMIDSEVSLYRDSFIEWAGAIGNLKIKEKSIRQWLLLSDKNISAWWFGLLADKDPFKSSAFLRIAQTEAILKGFKQSKSDIIALALKDYDLQKNMKLIFEDYGIKCQCIKVQVRDDSLSKKIKNHLKRRRIIKSFYALVKVLINIVYLKTRMPPLKNRRRNFNDALLVFTYFPSVIKEDALMGKFRNRFTIPLQDICNQGKKTIVWILAYGSYDGYSFKDAVKLAKKFIDNNEYIFFYLEFLSLKSLLKAFLEYLRVVLIWRRVRSELSHNDMNRIAGNSYALQFIFEALDDSFYGSHSLMGIIQYEALKNMFKDITGFSHGLYFCEMQVWEYAFVAAMRFNKINFPLIGYQHSSIPINQLSYFHSREELKDKNTPDGIPMPEILACNGSVTQNMMKRYYDKVENLEALRYIYLNEYLKKEKIVKSKNKFILMVCTGLEFEESIMIVNLIKAAYPKTDDKMKIWFKGHPAFPVQIYLRAVGIADNDKTYEVKEGDISTYFSQSNAILAVGSTAAIEALAFGCDVIVYFNPETVDKSPLSGFAEYYHKVYDPESLRDTINNIRSKKEHQDVEKKQKFVREYWNLDPNLDGWKRILRLS